ncbi:MAG: hypothetical protein A4E57_04185 [Syntrophorhabdaceae bacterium PtaU1.Bin034]|nr:MAG: hypothetical protein A4E57_04185 [Syntrophorhabdaceae bacterium PtaU1.Bin034]
MKKQYETAVKPKHETRQGKEKVKDDGRKTSK